MVAPLQGVDGFVGMYVCGPTLYSEPHMGNMRTFINFDTIYRYLLKLGYKVKYVRNITDAGHITNSAGVILSIVYCPPTPYPRGFGGRISGDDAQRLR